MIKIKNKNQDSKRSLKISNDRIDYNLCKPIFSFELLQDGFNFKNRKKLQNEHFKTFLYKIETLSNLTWLDIIRLPRENGMENIKLKIQTPNFITDDIQLKSIRFGKLERMIGYKMDNVFYLLYIDIDGSCYSH